MSTSGGGSGHHHRTFSRPNSSLARFASLNQGSSSQGNSPLIQSQPYPFSSLPLGGGGGGGQTGSRGTPGGLSRLQRHTSFVQQQQQHLPGFGGSLDREGARTEHFRTVELIKDEDNPSFGFNIKGGADYGTPVHIWRVEENSLADQRGLVRGQRILSANGIDFTRISHGNALKVLKGRSYLKLVLDTRMNGGSSSNVNSGGSASNSMVVETSHSSGGGGGVTGVTGGIGYTSFRGPMSSQPLPLTLPMSSSTSHSHSGLPISSSSTSSVVGGMAASSNYTYTWIDASGKVVPPPGPSSTSSSNKRVINIDINPGQNLGLMIRGGYEYGLGIYVTGVDHGSVAQRGGLQRGDEILEVNGRSFTSITHDKAVGILKSCRKMTIVANYIGKIPADNQGSGGGGVMPPLLGDSENAELIDLGGVGGVGGGGGKLLTTSMSESLHHHHHHHHNILMDSTNVTLFDDEDQDLIAEEEKLNDQNLELDYTGSSDPNNRLLHQDLEKSTSIMGMIEEKARTVLTKSEHSRFTFYRLEYQQGFLPIQSFVRILLELLNTVEKYTLLTEVREIIRPVDMVPFDELIYNKEASIGGGGVGGGLGKKAQLHRSDFPHPHQLQTGQGHPGQGGMGSGDPMLLPLVPVGPGNLNNPQIQGQCQGQGQGGLNGGGIVRRYSPHTIGASSSSTHPPMPHYNMNTMYNETTFTNPGGGGGGGGLQSLGSTPLVENNRQILLTHGDTQNVVAKLQQQKIAQGFGGGGAGGGGGASASPHNSCVRYKVRVQKTKPILGIAIEGGVNTPHRLPRIIDVNTEGSAYGSQLKPGQVLLTVDGKKLDGLSHEEIARTILDSYVDMSKPLIEFYVVEAKASFVQSQQQQLTMQTHSSGGIPPPPPGTGGGGGVGVNVNPNNQHAIPLGIPPPPPNNNLGGGGGGG